MRLSRTPVRAELRRPPPAAWPSTAATGSIPQPHDLQEPVQPQDDEATPDMVVGSRRASIVPGILLLGLLGLTGLAALMLQQSAAPLPHPSVVAAPVPNVPAARPRSGLQSAAAWSLWRDAYPPLDDHQPIAANPFRQARSFGPDFVFIDGVTLKTEAEMIRLAGVESLPPSSICIAAEGSKFACGLMARASLSMLTARQPISCFPDVSLDTAAPAYLCQAQGRDLAEAQISAGFALPSQRSLNRRQALVEAARAARLGAWNGDWTLMSPATKGAIQ